jgi:hypothetical protein
MIRKLWYNITQPLVTPPETVTESITMRSVYTVPKELKDAIRHIDKSCDDIKAYGWMPVSINLWNYIRNEEHNRLMIPGQKVLELGSGSGCGLLTWSYKGYPVTGIELIADLEQKSRSLLAEYPELTKAPITILQGSYYPKRYILDRNKGLHKKVIQLEQQEVRNWSERYVKETFHPTCGVDIYEKNGISIKDFDVIYAYLWQYQFPSVLDMFKKHARKDSVFLAIGPNHREIAQSLGLRTYKHSHVITK